jgi:hypothetical protein
MLLREITTVYCENHTKYIKQAKVKVKIHVLRDPGSPDSIVGTATGYRMDN